MQFDPPENGKGGGKLDLSLWREFPRRDGNKMKFSVAKKAKTRPRWLAQRDEHYSSGDDGLLVENVGRWATEKLKIVTDYIQASSAARRRYLGTGAAYIDVFAVARPIEDPHDRKIHRRKSGSSIPQGVRKGLWHRSPTMHISDADPELLSAAEKRLVKLESAGQNDPRACKAPLCQKIVQHLNPVGLHFAFP